MNYDFEDYKLKVNKYIEKNKNNIAIHKLRNNISITEADYKALEQIFTEELGTKEDYEKNYKDTPFGLLVVGWQKWIGGCIKLIILSNCGLKFL